MSSAHTHKPVRRSTNPSRARTRHRRVITGPLADLVPTDESVRIGVAWHLPEVLRGFGVDVADALHAAGLREDQFADPDHPIAYPQFERLLTACERLTGCEHIALLVGQRTHLTDFGLAGRAASCADTAGAGLRSFVDHFNLHSSATTVSLVESEGYARLVYAIYARGIVDARQFQLGAVAIAYNILQDLLGPRWRPTLVTVATRRPSDVQPFVRHFGAPLRFDSDESAVVFERHWLEHPLPAVEPALRQRVEDEVQASRAAILADLPAMVRRVLRKQLIAGDTRMDTVARIFGVHRRTLDRHLRRHGTCYGEVLDRLREDVARQLLRATRMPVREIAASLHFSSAANFATAFRRWTGLTPSEFRRGST